MGGAGSIHFADWLERTVGSIKAHPHASETLDALHTLREAGHLLATTNYDELLLDPHRAVSAVTWKEADAFIRAARNKEREKILFLHGYWRQPQSVVLDWTSYQQIARDDRYREDLNAFWRMTTWVYVGCGVQGLSDPDFGLLLERYGARARNAGLWDFCLVTESQRAEFQSHFDRLQLNICAVSMGDSHEELPRYLRSLLPAMAPFSPAAVPVSPVTGFLRVTDSFFEYHGDFRFTAEEFRIGTVHRAEVVEKALNRLDSAGIVWLEGPSAVGKTTVFLHLVNEWTYREGDPLYLDLSSDELDVERAAKEITEQAKKGRIFILDNVHDAPKAACALLDHWKTQRRDSVVILMGWPSISPDRDYLRGYRHAILRVAVQLEDWIGVYQSTYRYVRGADSVPPVPPPTVVRGWNENFAANLVTFQYSLFAALRSETGNAFRLEQAAANRYVREKYFDPCSDMERRDLYLLAWLAELGLPLPENAAPSGFIHSLTSGVLRKTFHGRFGEHMRYHPWHGSFARLLLGLAPGNGRAECLRQMAASAPFYVPLLLQRLHKHQEEELAAEVADHAITVQPDLTIWFGDNLGPAAKQIQLLKRFAASKCAAAIARLIQPGPLEKLSAQALASPLHSLAAFLRFAVGDEDLKPVHDALCKALENDVALPPDRSRLHDRVLASPLHLLADFLRLAMRVEDLKPAHAGLCRTLAKDAALPTGVSRLRSQVFASPLHFLADFLRFAGRVDPLKPVHAALCRALVEDAALPIGSSSLRDQALASPLGDLADFLRFAVRVDALKSVHTALCGALTEDAALPARDSRLKNQALASPLGDLANFLRFASQLDGLKSVHADLCRALAKDAALPTGESRLRSQALVSPLHFLADFLQFAWRDEYLKKVHAFLCRALAEDAALPIGESRLRDQALTSPLGHLANFLRFAIRVDGLKSLHADLCGALAKDAALAAGESRLQKQALASPLHILSDFLRFTWQNDDLMPVYDALCEALAKDVAEPSSHVLNQAFADPLGGVTNFLHFAGQDDNLQPVHAALCQALAKDGALSANRSRILETARATDRPNLLGFIIAAKSIPALSQLALFLEQECNVEWFPPTQPIPSQTDRDFADALERVLHRACSGIPRNLTPEARLQMAKQNAYRIIDRLPKHINKRVRSYLEKQKWLSLRAQIMP